MNYLAQLSTILGVQRALRYDRAQVEAVQSRKLRRLVDDAYQFNPYYRQRMDEARVEPGDVQSIADLQRLPVLTKADFQAADPRALLNHRYTPAQLSREQTSGSSGRPFVMYFDEAYRRMRKALFLRALMDCGYRPGQRLLIVTSREKTGVPAWMGWRYLSYKDDPQDNIQQHNAIRPHVLYGWVTPIRQMAEAARLSNTSLHRPHALITTAETLDPATRRLIGETFDCPVYEIYGLTETGTVAWQSPRHERFRVSHDALIVEFLPGPDAGPARRMVVTNLSLRSMPFIRYDTGDLAIPAPTPHNLINSALPAIDRFEGRQVDCVRLEDGRVVSPFELTTAMESVPGVRRYQISQEELDAFTVRYEATSNVGGSANVIVKTTQEVLGEVLGNRARIHVQSVMSLDPPSGQKFRVVQSRVAQSQVQMREVMA